MGMERGENNVQILSAIHNDDMEMIKGFLASMENKSQINSVLLVEGRTISGKYTPLSYAVIMRKLDVVKVLLDNGSDANCEGWCISKDVPSRYVFSNPLFIACSNKDSRMIKLLSENGLCIDAPIPPVRHVEEKGYVMKISSQGDTCLHWAVRKREENIVTALLENGANPNLKNNIGNTPLHIACQVRDLNILKRLVEFGSLFWPDHIGWCVIIKYLTDFGSLNGRCLEPLEKRREVIQFVLSTNYVFGNGNIFALALLEQSVEARDKLQTEEHPDFDWLKQLIMTPSPLVQICRVTIRKYIGRRCRPGVFSSLPLPEELIRFVSLES